MSLELLRCNTPHDMLGFNIHQLYLVFVDFCDDSTNDHQVTCHFSEIL